MFRRKQAVLAVLFTLLVVGGVMLIPQSMAFAGPGTFSNTTPIAIPGSGTVGNASPYPSAIGVSGLIGIVTDVNVTLMNVGHTFPDDIDILLVSPAGQGVILMSHVGSSTDAVNLTFTFDQSAGATLPGSGALASGTYRPSNYGSGQTFSGAPAGPYSSSLDVFNGSDPNGMWSLYAVDTFTFDSGSISGGWSLDITILPGDAPVITSSAVSYGMQGAAYTHTFTAVGDPAPTLSYSNENLPPGVTRSGDTLSGTPTSAGSFGITVTASNGFAPNAVQTFTIIIDTLPAPPPVPQAEDVNFNEESGVRTGIPSSLVDSINVRELYRDGAPVQWLGGDLYTSGSIGNPGVLELGVWQAIDIFSPGGLTYFYGGATFCLRGEGTLIWMAASRSPRIAEIIGSYTVPEFPGYTCAILFEPGTLVLVDSDGVPVDQGK